MLDLVIKGGSVIDGTGAPAKRADVGVRDGRIVEIGDINEKASTTLDAEGRVVTPGFVDLHTHYDPQVMWDPAATPSSFMVSLQFLAAIAAFQLRRLHQRRPIIYCRCWPVLKACPLKR